MKPQVSSQKWGAIRIFILIALLLVPALASAQPNEIDEDIDQNTVWDDEDGYLITANIAVNARLTIDQGIEVGFDGNFTLNASNGELDVEGLPENRVLFDNSNNLGFGNFDGNWASIILGDDSSIEEAEISNGGSGAAMIIIDGVEGVIIEDTDFDSSDVNGVNILNDSVFEISRCVFEHIDETGIQIRDNDAADTSFVIELCEIYADEIGIDVEGVDLDFDVLSEVRQCFIADSEIGIRVGSGVEFYHFLVRNCVICDCDTGVFVESDRDLDTHEDPCFKNNACFGCTDFGFYVQVEFQNMT